MNGALEVRTDRHGSSRDATTDFEGFFAEHRTALFGALWLVTRDRHEAEELARDGFLNVWERWERVRGLDDPVGHLYWTAMNPVPHPPPPGRPRPSSCGSAGATP